jgi:hypothetical protein
MFGLAGWTTTRLFPPCQARLRRGALHGLTGRAYARQTSQRTALRIVWNKRKWPPAFPILELTDISFAWPAAIRVIYPCGSGKQAITCSASFVEVRTFSMSSKVFPRVSIAQAAKTAPVASSQTAR